VSPRVACSEACASALAKADRAVDSILSKTVETTRRSGYFLLATGLMFVGVAVYGFIERPDMRLPNALAAAAAVILLVFGVWNCSFARRRE
jgi:FtsH-binding integral membrane protein